MMKTSTKKTQQIKSRLPIHIVVRGTNYEFSAEAPASRLSQELDQLQRLNNLIARTLTGTRLVSVTVPAPEIDFTEAPSIKAAKSTMDNIQALFSTEWGRNPRTVSDVLKALEVNAVPDTTTAVSVYLSRLVKKGTLRRIRKSGKYQYYRIPHS
jgi:hypothetical protein